MFLLKASGNDRAKGPQPGDALVSADMQKSYMVSDDGSHYRTVPEAHTKILQKLKAELAELPQRRAVAEIMAKIFN